MGKAIQNPSNGQIPRSKADLRNDAFMQQRKVVTDEELGIVPATRGRKKKQVVQVPTMAAARLDALQIYRQRLEEQLQALKKRKKSRDVIAAPPANNWRPLGPSVVVMGQAATRPSVSGRTPGLAVAPGGLRIYAATANGGVWRSDDGGGSWVSLMENFDVNPSTSPSPRRADSLAYGAIAIEAGPSHAQDVIYAGSGEGFNMMFGIGPVVSTDGGANWVTEAVTGSPLLGEGFFALVVDPNLPGRVVAATTAGIYRREPQVAPASGFRWVQKTFTPLHLPKIIVSSVVVASVGGVTTFFAVQYINSAITQPQVFSSNTGDNNWTPVGNPLPAGLMRITLAVRSNDPSVVYAFASTGMVFRWEASDPSGNWVMVTTLPPPGQLVGTQGNYDLSIAVAPDNVNRIYLGGSTVPSDPEGNINPPNFDSAAKHGAAIYRCDLTVVRTGASVTSITSSNKFLGASIHADIHTIVFSRNPDGSHNPSKMWVGCDGGIFFTSNPTGTGRIFEAKNNGLQTLMMHHLAAHPMEDSILFCGTQDNGGLLFSGMETWLHSTPGDCGHAVIDWNDPMNIISTGFFRINPAPPAVVSSLRLSTDGGTSYGLKFLGIPMVLAERVLFYAPLAGVPSEVPGVPRTNAPASDSRIIAVGSNRPWISADFGQNWRSIPNNSLTPPNSDALDERISSLEFATSSILYAGTMNGSVYRFLKGMDGNWTRRQIYDANTDTPNAWNVKVAVTDIGIDPFDANKIYVVLGGIGAYTHVYHGDITNPATPVWTARNGNVGTNLLNIHHSAIAIDPANNQILFVGADIGIWRSVNGGGDWSPYSEALPDAAIIDLHILRQRQDPDAPASTLRPAILRAATHGRGVWERQINTETGFPGVELFIRRTKLDLGRHRVLASTVANLEQSPDLKIDTPDEHGAYQFGPNDRINFLQFTHTLQDKREQVGTLISGILRSLIYVQVHNRGVLPADDVRVMILMANANNGIPNLPANYHFDVQNGTSIHAGGWTTVGIQSLHQVRTGVPQVAVFNLDSHLFPSSDNLNDDNNQFVLIALTHHVSDPFVAAPVVVREAITAATGRKAAMKILTVVNFTGTPPPANLRTPLEGFVGIPASATQANMPYDHFLAWAFHNNDDFLLKTSEAVLAHPLSAKTQASPLVPNPSSIQLVQAEEISITNPITLESKTPLVWMATKKITINNTIHAEGKGAPASEAGDFGGSGGGGSTAGHSCALPFNGVRLVEGGIIGNGNGNPLNADWATRALLHPVACKGGASGGGAAGGAGGGIVILCAPTIEFAPGGLIDASGQAATGANSGGGGGGLIVLIAGEIIGMKEPPDASPNVIVNGGAGNSGGNGGAGVVLKKIFN